MPEQSDSSGVRTPPSTPDPVSKSTIGVARARPSQSVLGEARYWWVLVFIFCLFLAAGAYHEGEEKLLSGANYFAPVYAVTTLVGTPDIYNPDKIHEIITRGLGGGPIPRGD